jgi:hypothetical protein
MVIAGTVPESGLREGADLLRRSIVIFDQVGNDIELANTCQAYAGLLRRAPYLGKDPTRISEADRMSARAEAILSKATPRIDDEVTEVTTRDFAS